MLVATWRDDATSKLQGLTGVKASDCDGDWVIKVTKITTLSKFWNSFQEDGKHKDVDITNKDGDADNFEKLKSQWALWTLECRCFTRICNHTGSFK